MHESIAALACSFDVAVSDEIRTDAFEDSEAELTKLLGLTPTESALTVNLAVAAFLRETSPARLAELAGRPEALALAPALMPENVVTFRRRG